MASIIRVKHNLFCLFSKLLRPTTGYFEPEDCDDIIKNCTYHPIPCFDNLKKAYTESVIANITKYDDFDIPENRRKRADCPKGFPAISEFVWKSDDQPFGECPSKETFQFTCSARGNIKKRPRAKGTSTFLALVGGIVAAVAGVALVRRFDVDIEEKGGLP